VLGPPPSAKEKRQLDLSGVSLIMFLCLDLHHEILPK